MPSNRYNVGPGVLTVGEAGDLITLQAQCRSCLLTPSANTEDDVYVLSDEVIPGEMTFTESMKVLLVQDLTSGGINSWSRVHAGESVPFVFRPSNAVARQVTGTLRVVPVAIGGDVRTRAEAEVEWPLVGLATISDVA